MAFENQNYHYHEMDLYNTFLRNNLQKSFRISTNLLINFVKIKKNIREEARLPQKLSAIFPKIRLIL